MLSEHDVVFGGLAALLATAIWIGYLVGRPLEGFLVAVLLAILILLPLALIAVTRQERIEKQCSRELQYWEDKGVPSSRFVALQILGTFFGCVASILLAFTGLGEHLLPALRVTSFFGAAWLTASTLLRFLTMPLVLRQKLPGIVIYEKGLRFRSLFVPWTEMQAIRPRWSFIADDRYASFQILTSRGKRTIRVYDLAGFRQTLRSLHQERLLVMP
jgi:hypothetical protein